MTADEAFEEDLRRWVHRFYAQRELLATERSHSAVERIFDQERRVLTWLAAQLMLAIALLPWWGAWGVLGGLSILYLGTIVSGAWTLEKERRVTRRTPPAAVVAQAERAIAACPPLDADARALLIRLMNLTELRPTPRSLELVRQELRDALALPSLVRWSFLQELWDVLGSPDGARLDTLRPQPAE